MLARVGLITQVDVDAFYMYCEAVACLHKTQAVIRRNPHLARELRAQSRWVTKLAAEVGIGPSLRALSTEPKKTKKPADEFEAFLHDAPTP
jgi:phage terminase small subunit